MTPTPERLAEIAGLLRHLHGSDPTINSMLDSVADELDPAPIEVDPEPVAWMRRNGDEWSTTTDPTVAQSWSANITVKGAWLLPDIDIGPVVPLYRQAES